MARSCYRNRSTRSLFKRRSPVTTALVLSLSGCSSADAALASASACYRTESKLLFREASTRGTGYPVSNFLVRASCLNPSAPLTANREVTVAYLRVDDTTEQARVDIIFPPGDRHPRNRSLRHTVVLRRTREISRNRSRLSSPHAKVFREWVAPRDTALAGPDAHDARMLSEEIVRSIRAKRHHLDRRSDRDDLSSSPYR